MGKQIERTILIVTTLIGIGLVPFWVKKPPIKDWTIVFLLAGFLSGMLDLFVTAKKLISYPTRLFGKRMNISLLFDYLVLPTIGVVYNQVSYRPKVFSALSKAFLFSAPVTALEFFLEKHTKLIVWKKWKWQYTLISVTLFLWIERGFIATIRSISDSQYIGKKRSDQSE
ncbi:hypothetical protein CFK37_02910 [Virgibacillus phasianinus]|uniref:Uncharacterized protein n=1 Tax=Virgibacillus phasianinus TaxID=2017483 RepID=A0A220TZG7_9BACI|nr:CBO0543 family protein [Virgibacillus phasianinus]ASK61217.1 hypothetical protein CFK37_02910 [Virgibacillus phasianinus]